MFIKIQYPVLQQFSLLIDIIKIKYIIKFKNAGYYQDISLWNDKYISEVKHHLHTNYH